MNKVILNTEDSKEDTSNKSSSEEKSSLDNSILFIHSPITSFLPLKNRGLIKTYESEEKIEQLNYFSQFNILKTFYSQKLTKDLQKRLVGISKDVINKIIIELSGTFREVIKNKNGNYFCSNLIKVCDREQRIIILKELSKTLSEDCNDRYGTYPIQKLFEFASTEEEFQLLLSSFNDLNIILMASLNQYGSFVIQKLIKHIPEKLRMDFNLILVKLVCILSRNIYGVRAIKEFIKYSKNYLIIKQILNLISKNFVNISMNKYGNYLIQFLLEKWWDKEEGIILKNIIISKFHILSKNAFSSHICDLFIKLNNNEKKRNINKNK